MNKILLSDGAWGTILQAKGLKPGECPELWNIHTGQKFKEIAESYLHAGSDIIATNSFGGSRIKLSQYGLGERVAEINQAAAAISREAAGKDKHVAGSIGPTGKMLLMGDVTEDELYDAFSEQAIALEKGGADIIIIETMSAADEASLAVKAARENTECTVIITMTFSRDTERRIPYHDGCFTGGDGNLNEGGRSSHHWIKLRQRHQGYDWHCQSNQVSR